MSLSRFRLGAVPDTFGPGTLPLPPLIGLGVRGGGGVVMAPPTGCGQLPEESTSSLSPCLDRDDAPLLSGAMTAGYEERSVERGRGRGQEMMPGCGCGCGRC